MENKLLTETKDEYAREQTYKTVEAMRHFSGWGDFWVYCNGIGVSKGSRLKEAIDTIATRYAAKENEGLIRDVKNLRSAVLNYLDCQFNAKYKSVSEIVNAGTELRNLLSKTSHYDNQNTDV